MKRMKIALSVVFIALTATVSQADTLIYSEAFGGDGSSGMDGVAPTTGVGLWDAKSSFLNTDGTINGGGANGAWAGSTLLAFAPELNKVYTLSMDLNHTGNSTVLADLKYIGLGFTQTGINDAVVDTSNRFPNLNGSAWFEYGQAGAIKIWGGLASANAIANTGAYVGGSVVTLTIKINTDGDGSSFKADFLINGTSIIGGYQTIDTAVDDLNYVGIGTYGTRNGDSPVGSVVDNFQLSVTQGMAPLTVASPVTRQVVQRDESNLGSIPVAGTAGSAGSPIDRVEARAVAPSYDKDLGAIWFVGDSITQSNADGDSNGSPRKSLYDLLVAERASFSFTGHFTANVDGLPTTGATAETDLYRYHSGVSGSCIGQNTKGRTDMTANIPGWWNSGRLASTRPNIVLIMLGTNDTDLNDNVADAPNRIKTLVDTILAQVGSSDPAPAIFVAQIPPNAKSTDAAQRAIDFNNALPAVIATLQAEGKDVTLVDQFTLINADIEGLMWNALHPNSNGNDVMASQWFEAIKTRFAITSSFPSTPWQTIATNPEGAFAGTLTDVEAGGWYSVEVRTVIDENPVQTGAIDKVGVGDIYLTAGQSNAANYGSPTAPPIDDRVAARSGVSTNAWVLAADPLPIATGSGGSVWSRLGDLLAEEEDIPIGFVALGSGGSLLSQWAPGTSNYDNLLKPAIQSFPADGFRAVLWHQGESDSVAGVTASTHASQLNAMIAQSRIDAGWSIPWYLAEASFHPDSNLENEEQVTAGQRAAVHSDPLIFLGPSTDEFHLEDADGGKLTDLVHFNAAGLLDHASQWRDILLGTTSIHPRNNGFEDNRTPVITDLSSLPDGDVHRAAVDVGDSPMVLDWRILAAGGSEAADGNNGFHNPTIGTYAGAVDTTNGGVLPNMKGGHVALLDGGSAGNYFLQSSRAPAEADTIYTLTVALGVRDIPASFGIARLEITANGAVVASAPFDKAALDILGDSDVSGTFTDVSISWTAGSTVAANQPLAIRIVKEGGAGTVLDFDNVRFTAAANIFSNYMAGFSIGNLNNFDDDPDGDGLPNGIEAWFGTHPGEDNPGLSGLATDGTTTTFNHPQSETPPSDLSGFYQWSHDLVDWYGSGTGPAGGPTVTLVPIMVGTTSTVTATASEAQEQLFLRAGATQN